MRFRGPVLGALIPLLWACPVAAQSLPELEAGTRVRVAAPGLFEGRVTGILDTARPGGLTILPAATGDRLTVPHHVIESLEVSLGRERAKWVVGGALVGLVAGVGLGVACVDLCPDRGGANMAPVGGAFLGPPIGALLGGMLAPERWEWVYPRD